MSLSDPIADMLTRLRNAVMAGKDSVQVPYSNLKNEIARILKREGYINDVAIERDGVKQTIVLSMRYSVNSEAVIHGLKRISRPGLRHYVASAEVPRVLGGMGLAILSTSKGILTDREARKSNVGGEVVCYVW